MFIICVVLHRRRIRCSALVCRRGFALNGEFRRKRSCFARAIDDVCCHCFCVIPLVQSFLGERLAHPDAADCDGDQQLMIRTACFGFLHARSVKQHNITLVRLIAQINNGGFRQLV